MDQENITPQEEKNTVEEKLRKENKLMKIALMSIAGVLLVALAVVLFFVVYNGIKPETAETDNSGFTSYVVSDEKAVDASDVVVAQVGDKKLTNGELSAYYWMQIYDFISTYGAYANIDWTKPLGQQVYNTTTGQTWEELFLEQALNNWNRYIVLQTMGEKAGFVLTADVQKQYDELPDSLSALALELDFHSVEEMIAHEMGAGCTVEGYLSYMYTSYYCNDYFNELYRTLTPTTEEIEIYFEENKDTFVNGGVTKEKGKAIDVRHILFIPEGGTATEGSNYMTYTDEAWENCRQDAQKVLDQFLAGERTETAFAKLATQFSADGSAANGGLITNVLAGNTVTNFNDWIFDESRKEGDYGLVRTEYGYHIMYFVDSEEYWIRMARNNMVGESAAALIDAAIAATPMEVKLDLVALSQANLED